MDRYFMQLALKLASKAIGKTSPNPLVGAVLVQNKKIVGKGFHARAGTSHAEIIALTEAGENARGATLYVTLEPCCHHGKTGPCTKAIIKAGVGRVVVAAKDPNPLVSGKGIKEMRDAGIEVETGIMEKESIKLNEVFNKYITSKIPFIVAKAAMSLDGKIATSSGQSQWITGEDARQNAHYLRNCYDAILVGIGTVLSDNPSLTVRLGSGEGRDPVRVVLDSKARTPPSCKMLNQVSSASTYIAVTENADQENIKKLSDVGAKVITFTSSEKGEVDLNALLAFLGKKEITSVLVEGGAMVHGSFIKEKLVDKVVWYIAPLLIGGENAPGPVGGSGYQGLQNALRLYDMKFERCGMDFIVKGYPQK